METVVETVKQHRLPDITIESVARGFYREAESYGFGPGDFIRFMSALLDIARKRVTSGDSASMPESSVEHTGTDVVSIRAFDRAADLATLHRWLDDSQSRGFLPPQPGGRARTIDDIVADPRSVLGTVTLPDGTPIGLIAFLNYDAEQRTAELRKLISGDGLRGRGYGKAATRLWLRYGFEELRLHKIYLTTLDTNVRNIRLNERLGFTLEGIFRDELFIDGRYHDVLRMAIWNPEHRA
jgi:RimJ/RimL family protein N-acetyltransferase